MLKVRNSVKIKKYICNLQITIHCLVVHYDYFRLLTQSLETTVTSRNEHCLYLFSTEQNTPESQQ